MRLPFQFEGGGLPPLHQLVGQPPRDAGGQRQDRSLHHPYDHRTSKREWAGQCYCDIIVFISLSQVYTHMEIHYAPIKKLGYEQASAIKH